MIATSVLLLIVPHLLFFMLTQFNLPTTLPFNLSEFWRQLCSTRARGACLDLIAVVRRRSVCENVSKNKNEGDVIVRISLVEICGDSFRQKVEL